MNENEQIIQSLLDLANRREGSAIHAYLADSMQIVDPILGTSAASRLHAVQSALLAAFPDLHYRIIRTISSGDSIVVECRLSGTQSGPFAGLPPTYKAIDIPAAFSIQLVDGKLSDCLSYFDAITLMEQLGRMPPPAAQAATTVVT